MDQNMQLGWLASTEPRFREEVISRSELRHVKAGGPVYLQGDEARGLYGLVEGTVEVCIATTDGSPSLIYLARRGWWFGALEIFSRQPRRFQIQARTDCRFMFLGTGQVREICKLSSEYWEEFARLMCGNYEGLLDTVALLRDQSPTRRISGALRILHSRQTEPQPVIEATQADLASIANVSLRSAAAALANLERSGALERGYGTITVLDKSKLSKTD